MAKKVSGKNVQGKDTPQVSGHKVHKCYLCGEETTGLIPVRHHTSSGSGSMKWRHADGPSTQKAPGWPTCQ